MVSQLNISTREKLITAGLALFSSKGFSSTTTRELASEAGVAEVTLFRHFSSKERLLEEVIVQRSPIPALTALKANIADRLCDDALKVIAETLLDSMIERKEWIVLLQAEVRRDPEKLLVVYHSYLDRYFTLIAGFFREQQECGQMRRTFDPDLAARALYGMIFSFFNTEEVLHRKDYRATSRCTAINEFVSLFSKGASA